VGGNNERLWQKLCEAVGRPDLVEDPRFQTNDERMAHRPELVAELECALAARGTDAWVAALSEAGVPCGPIHDYGQVFEDEHTQARAMEVRLEHPVEGEIRALGIPVKLSDTPGSIRHAAPLLGQHTAEVLAQAGFTAEQIEALSPSPPAPGAQPPGGGTPWA
jgi:formyl-CoA transferase